MSVGVPGSPSGGFCRCLQEAVGALRTAEGELTLTVCHGYDPEEVERRVADGRLVQAKSASQSVSSLDRPESPPPAVAPAPDVSQQSCRRHI